MADKRKEYIHYGSKFFDKNKFDKISNVYGMTKPFGGLWASDKNAKYGWKQWCEESNFRNNSENNSFTFKLSNGANVAHIYSREDVIKLPHVKNDFASFCNWVFLDFEKIKEIGIDAIELHLSEEKDHTGIMDGLRHVLNLWDCDSILILNPDIIESE